MKTEPVTVGEIQPTAELTPDETPKSILSSLKEHAAEARLHERAIEAKADAALEGLANGVKRVEDLRHTAITLAAVLLFAVIILAKC